MGKNSWLLIKWACAALFLFMLAFTTVDNFLGMHGVKWLRWQAGILGTAVTGTGFLLASRKRREIIYPSFPPPRSGPVQLTQHERHGAVETLRHFLKENRKGVIPFVQGMVTAPANYIERASVEVEVKHQSAQVETMLTINVPDASDTEHDNLLLIPAIWVEKGSFVPNLRLEDREGKPIPQLGQDLTKSVLSLVVISLFRDAYLQGRRPQLDTREIQLLEELMDYVWRVDAFEADKVDKILNDARLIAAGRFWEGGLNEQAHNRLARLCELLARHYLILTEMKAYSRCMLKYTRTLPLTGGAKEPDRASSSDTESRWYSFVRLMFGAGPYRFYATIWLPFLARSYHLRINGPDDQYVAAHALLYRWEDEDGKIAYLPVHKNTAFTKSGVDIHIENPSGVPYSHLYMRGLAMEPPPQDKKRVPIQRLATHVRYAEVPPGVLGMATLASTLLTIFIATFTVISPDHPVLKQPVVAVPGLMLTLLVVLISWLGLNTDRESVLRASMSARAGLVGVIVVLLAGVLLYANTTWIIRPTWSLSFFGGWWTWNDLNVWWVVLSFLSFMLSTTLLIIFAVRTARYVRLKGH